MKLDVMARADSWKNIAGFAREPESVGVPGMPSTEIGQAPWTIWVRRPNDSRVLSGLAFLYSSRSTCLSHDTLIEYSGLLRCS
jgi:hypothetical protein